MIHLYIICILSIRRAGAIMIEVQSRISTLLILLCLICCSIAYERNGIISRRDARCDPVGSEQLFHPSRRQSVHMRCVCRDGFYGYRCERIYRCVSGSPVNTSCSFPSQNFRSQVNQRCLPGQVDLEVCNCFPGYYGDRCELTGYKNLHLHDRYEPAIQPPWRSDENRSPEIELREPMVVHSYIEEQNNLTSQYRTLVFTILFITLVAIVGVYSYFVILRRGLYKRIRQVSTALHLIDTLEELDEPLAKPPNAPPPYEDHEDCPPGYEIERSPGTPTNSVATLNGHITSVEVSVEQNSQNEITESHIASDSNGEKEQKGQEEEEEEETSTPKKYSRPFLHV